MPKFVISVLDYLNLISLKFNYFLKEEKPKQRRWILYLGVAVTIFFIGFGVSSRKDQPLNVTPTSAKSYYAVKNGDIEVGYTKAQYNPSSQMMTINVKAQGGNQELLGNDLKFKVNTYSHLPQATVDVIPTFDNQWLVVVRHLPKNFGSLAIQVNSTLPQDISETSTDDQTPETMLVLVESKVKIDHQLQAHDRDYFAQTAVNDEITSQQKQIKAHNKKIKYYEGLIKHNKTQIINQSSGDKYRTNDEQKQNSQSIETLKGQNDSYNDQIAEEKISISAIEQKIKKLKLKLRDIKNGDFKYPKTSKTKKANKVQLINQSKENK